MTDTIKWIAGCTVAVSMIASLAFLIVNAMTNDYKLRSECITQGGVYSFGAGACTFSKQVSP